MVAGFSAYGLVFLPDPLDPLFVTCQVTPNSGTAQASTAGPATETPDSGTAQASNANTAPASATAAAGANQTKKNTFKEYLFRKKAVSGKGRDKGKGKGKRERSAEAKSCQTLFRFVTGMLVVHESRVQGYQGL